MVRYKRAPLALLSALIAVLTLGCTTASEGGLDVAVAVETNGGTTYVLIGVLGSASATVTVNGEEFIVDFLHYGPLSTPVAANDTVDVQVTSSQGNTSASLVMPGPPSVTSPGPSVEPASPIAVAWARTTPYPEQYIVKIGYFDTASGEDYEGQESGDATGHTIPANILEADRIDSGIVVGGISTTSLGGGLSGRSELTVINSVTVPVDT